MKRAYTADIHVEKNKNLPFVIKTCKWIGDTCRKQGVDTLTVAGDFGNSRNKIDVYALNKMIEILMYWKNLALDIELLLGNHELYHMQNLVENQEITSLKAFSGICKVIDKFEIQRHKDAFFYYIPWVDNKALYEQMIQTACDAVSRSQKAILVSHQEIRGSVTNDLARTKNSNGINPTNLGTFDKAFFGHYHTRQCINDNIYYVGSPITLNHGEAGSDKGLTIYDTETDTVEFFKNPFNPTYITLPYDIDYINELINDKQFDITKFVRIKADINPLEKEELTNLLMSKGVLEVVHQPIVTAKDDNDTNIDLEDKSLDDIVQEYIDGNATDDMDKDYLTKLSRELMEI